MNLVSSELKLGELASGEVVAEVRKYADEINQIKAEVVLIDSAAGIGYPVIASLVGTDYIIAVTEPTPSAPHDLKRKFRCLEYGHNWGILIEVQDLLTVRSAKALTFIEQKKMEAMLVEVEELEEEVHHG